LPKGQFQKVSIEVDNYIIFEVPADKMAEFEVGFRREVQNATPLKGILCCLSPELKIKTGKGKYSAYICYDDDDVTIYGNDIFERGFVSRELRKVFYDAGLKYTSGGPKSPRKRDVNECLENLRQSGFKVAEHGRRVKEAKEREKEANEPNQ
jgi:hypothetical protein